ncbi:heme ABC transporter substrate-binding protein IsdE [Siminovitchia sp. FSL H7-0308]|uniref:heme ABC transporter substrate-binding protein IsdE n=1 Tax=Siminovitchia sp. FSL H7-0308 TaxID=2921432 RepID=UPI0030EEA72B
MRKSLATLFGTVFILLFLITTSGCSSQQKKEATEEKESQDKDRIVSTTVAVTEIMDALEIDLVGIPTSYKKLPQRYDGVTEVGNPMSPDMELIMSLDPTEVMSVTTLKYDLVSHFEELGVPVTFVNLESIDHMLSEIRKIGEKYDRKEQAEAIVEKFHAKASEIEKRVKGKKSPTVLILMGVPGSYLVATEKSYIGDLVKRSGGINVVQGEDVEYLASNTEYLHQSNPDIILRAAHGMPEEVVEMFDKEFKENDIWKHFDAVKNGRVYDLEETLFGTTGNLAVTEALEELQPMLYP